MLAWKSGHYRGFLDGKETRNKHRLKQKPDKYAAFFLKMSQAANITYRNTGDDKVL
jgi:hypothetical protein